MSFFDGSNNLSTTYNSNTTLSSEKSVDRNESNRNVIEQTIESNKCNNNRRDVWVYNWVMESGQSGMMQGVEVDASRV